MSKVGSRVLRLLDGGTGELLFHKGLPDDRITWSALAITNSKYHSLVTETHLDFLNAGSRIITTNNYSITPGCLKAVNKEENIGYYTKISVDLAKNAQALFYKQNPENKDKILIAGSIPPLNQSYRSDILLSDYECNYWYNIIINTLHENNCDIFLCETMSCIRECEYAMKIIQKLNNNNKKCWISFCVNKNGLLRSNESLNDVINKLQIYFIDNNIEIISINCSTPESINNALNSINNNSNQILKQFGIQIGCYANAYTYIPDTWSLDSTEHSKRRDIMTPKHYYETFVKRWIDKYSFIGMIGGCCGMFAEHIKYIKQNIENDCPHIALCTNNENMTTRSRL